MTRIFALQFHGWRVGQSAKTPPFHGGMTGSIPVRATERELSMKKLKLPFLFSSKTRAPSAIRLMNGFNFGVR